MKKCAVFWCPKCTRIITLEQRHEIAKCDCKTFDVITIICDECTPEAKKALREVIAMKDKECK